MSNFSIDKSELTERFMRYVQVDTQSDPNSNAYPTTEKQKNLSAMLAEELKQMGVPEVSADEFGYVYAGIPGNSTKAGVPAICFCSHVDTAPDCSGTHVKPILHRNYDGSDIILPDDPAQVLSTKHIPYLKQHIGGDIVTASGNTLLGADDKAGVAIIMQLAKTLCSDPSIVHGPVRIVFTPDEEVGRGTAKIDMKKVGAVAGYTLDGGEAGCLEDETFSADGATITIHGVIAHPGQAKGVMVNAIKIAGAVLDALPKDEWSPETTDKKQGFVHPVSVSGMAEKATIQFIVRDFVTANLDLHHSRLKSIAEKAVSGFPGASFGYAQQEQYRNMKDILDQHPHIVANAKEAIRRAGLTVSMDSIRGGTDGSRLSYMGLPCPNIFTGMQNIHGKQEWVGVNDMTKAVETLIHLSMIWEEKAPN